MKHHQHIHPTWQIFALLAITPLYLSSCDKTRQMIGKLKQKSAPVTSSQSGEWITQVSAGNFDSFRAQPGKVVVIDFYADWCGPCRMLAPILDRIADDHVGLILIGKVNVDQNRELATSAGVQSIPDVRIFREGREVDRFVGLPSADEVRRRVESHTKGLSAANATVPTGETPVAREQKIAPAPKDWLPPGMQRR